MHVNKVSVTVSQPEQYQNLETEAAKLYSAIIDFVINICVFPTVTCFYCCDTPHCSSVHCACSNICPGTTIDTQLHPHIHTHFPVLAQTNFFVRLMHGNRHWEEREPLEQRTRANLSLSPGKRLSW